MRRRFVALLCTVVLLPFIALAAGLPAGFAPTSIFASKTSIAAGDSISLFSVLYNSSADELTADVVFTVDDKSVGTKHLSLAPGETQTPSVSWTAVRGSHTASAHLENIVSSSGEGASLLNTKADTITIEVSAPPPPSPSAQAVASVTSALQSGIASSTLIVTNVAQKAYNSLEYLRENAVNTLQGQLASSAASGLSTSPAKVSGQVLGTSTYKTSASAATNTRQSGIFSSIWRAILTALIFICNIQILFYGLLLIVIFVLYRLLRTWMSER